MMHGIFAAHTGPPKKHGHAAGATNKWPIGGDIHGHASAKMAKLAGHFRP